MLSGKRTAPSLKVDENAQEYKETKKAAYMTMHRAMKVDRRMKNATQLQAT